MKSPSEDGSIVYDTERAKHFSKVPQNNLIQTTRDFVSKFSDEKRYTLAKQHVNNALRYKQPRFDIINTEQKRFYHRLYFLQTSFLWQLIVSILSFTYMYIIVFENTSMNNIYQVGSPIVYSFFILDFIMQTYHQNFDEVSRKSRFSTIFTTKVLVLSILLIDQIFVGFEFAVSGRELHPFRVFRVILPIIYNRQIYRSFQSLFSAYKDIFVYFIFYSVMVITFAIITSQLIILPQNQQVDDYKNNYNDLSRMIFIIYVLGTYDSYPDNQLPALRSQLAYYGIFILFIFLNMFIFSSIPGSLIFDKFRETRGKLQLLDQTKMQSSLIVAFITLGQENYQTDIQKMIRFLLYFYQNRVRFVDTVTNICLKLNPNDHSSIHINQFMQLGRILQQNSNLRPPLCSDFQNWIKFRQFINQHLHLNELVNSPVFKLINALLIVGACINAFFFLYYGLQLNGTIDNVFANIFFIELLIKLIAHGPQNYFNQIFNGADFTIIMLGFTLQFSFSLTDQDSLLRMFRIFKASFLIQIMINNRFWTLQVSIYRNLHNLFQRMATIVPIIIKFTPLYLLTYYVLGVLGMQAFYEAYQLPPSPQYSTYDQFSNFKNFIDTQLYFVQVLTQAGWSSVAFDVAKRMPDYFGCIMIFFAVIHVIIVLILATLIKGIVWSTFITVSQQYENNKIQEQIDIDRQAKVKVKFLQLEMLDHVISKLDSLKLDSVVKRQVYESRMNEEVLQKLKRINKHKKLGRKSTKGAAQQTLYRNFGINRVLLEEQEIQKNNYQSTQKYIVQVLDKFTREKFNDEHIGFLDLQDYQERVQKICKNMRGNVEKGICMEMKDNELLNQHLSSKLQTPCSLKSTEKKENDSASLHIFDMHILLGMQTTWREQKTLVIRGLIQRGIIEASVGNELLHKSMGVKGFKLDQDCTIRKTYLQGTAPKLIQKFEAEYFGNIYGKAFKEINKVTIEPLIKLQSTMVYTLKNICRYPHMSKTQFFRILTKIENTISNQLLKSGSLFKFVFQLNCDKNIWFTIRFDGKAAPHLSFLKHGVWLHNKSHSEHQIYYAKDLFRFQKSCTQGNLLERANLIKKLYETFQSLALTLEGKEIFFESNPQYHVYDNYFTFIDVEPIQRLIQRQLQISKVMVVLLTKQNQRTPQQQIPFQVSEIPIQKFEAQIQFKLDETENQTFKKLASLASLNDEQATARQGLPFSYVLNFLQQINDILRLHSPNFIHHVQNLLNEQLHQPSN